MAAGRPKGTIRASGKVFLPHKASLSFREFPGISGKHFCPADLPGVSGKVQEALPGQFTGVRIRRGAVSRSCRVPSSVDAQGPVTRTFSVLPHTALRQGKPVADELHYDRTTLVARDLVPIRHLAHDLPAEFDDLTETRDRRVQGGGLEGAALDCLQEQVLRVGKPGEVSLGLLNQLPGQFLF